jgi:hypothetical protein
MLAERNTSGMFTVLPTVDFKFINNFKIKRWKLYFKCGLPHFTQHTLWNFSVLCNRLSINSINSNDFSFFVCEMTYYITLCSDFHLFLWPLQLCCISRTGLVNDGILSQMYTGLYRKCPLFLFDFNQKYTVTRNCSKYLYIPPPFPI